MKTLFRRILATLLWTAWGGALAQERVLSAFNLNSQYGRDIAPLVWWSVGLSVIVLFGTGGALWYVVHRFRAKPTDTEEPPQFHGNNALELILFAVPVAMVAVLTILTANTIMKVNAVPKTGTVKVDITGWQFWWDFQYPDLKIRNSNELIIPVGTPIEMNVVGGDVIHSFWITSLGAKRDAIPGQKGHFVLTAEKPGIYYGQCTELCGASHANMLFRVIALEPQEFDAFVKEAQAFTPSSTTQAANSVREVEVSSAQAASTQPSSGAPQRDTGEPNPSTRNQPVRPVQPVTGQNLAQGRKQFEQYCAACHAVKGTGARGVVGPDLSYLGNRTMIGAGLFKNEPATLRKWILQSPKMKPGIKMPAFDGSDPAYPRLSDAQVDAISDYLENNRVNLDLSKFKNQVEN